jgi:hypothetical protein
MPYSDDPNSQLPTEPSALEEEEEEVVGKIVTEEDETEALLFLGGENDEGFPMAKKRVQRTKNDSSSQSFSHWLRLAAGGAFIVAAVILYLLSSSFSEQNGARRHSPQKARLDANQVLRELHARFRVERAKMEAKLRVEYGEYYEAMFTRSLDATNPAVAVRKNRLKRDGQTVLAIEKIDGVEEDSNSDNGREPDGGGPIDNSKNATDIGKKVVVSVGRVILQSPTLRQEWGPRRMRNLMMRKLLQVLVVTGDDFDNDHKDPNAVTFVWATGGHSSSAGHGNLHNESYTAVLERAVSGVFQSAGIRFEGRNRAMGGTNSYPEIALCGQEVFGLDIDVLSWDYAMVRL